MKTTGFNVETINAYQLNRFHLHIMEIQIVTKKSKSADDDIHVK